MRVLILSCNTGEGHNAAGKAVLDYVVRQGHEAVLTDVMLLAGRRTSRTVGGAYVGIVKKTPRFFALLYKAGSLISSAKWRSPVYYANTLLCNSLGEYLAQNNFDVIVTPHLFAAEALTCLKNRGLLRQKVISVGTDYTCIPFWEETKCDYYVIPHPDIAEEYVSRGIPREKLLPYGIPVGLSFCQKKNKADARQACGLPSRGPAYLIMSGSMGFGKVKDLTRELLRQSGSKEQVVVICGSNEKLRDNLQEEFRSSGNVHILAYTDRVSDYMDACDVVFTKPGGLTSTEAAVKNIPIVHTAPIPGCETKNMDFFVSRGMSVTAAEIPEQAAAGRRLARQKNDRDSMQKAQSRQISSAAAKDIFQLLLTLSGEDKT